MSLWHNRNWSPMLLGEVFEPFNSMDYIYEIKFDGIRAIIFVDANNIKIISRNNKDLTHLFPELKDICNLVKENTIFDGEIIAMENGRPSFESIQKRIRLKDQKKINFFALNDSVIFICFDILYKTKNLINIPLIERKKILDSYPDTEFFVKSKVIENDGKLLFAYAEDKKLEGIVAKKKDSIYQINTRSDNWLKIKCIKTENFYIGGYINKDANYVVSIFLGEFKENKFLFVGKATLSKKTKLFKEIISQQTTIQSPFINLNNPEPIYIFPSIKCRVSYLERTKQNKLRHPKIILK